MSRDRLLLILAITLLALAMTTRFAGTVVALLVLVAIPLGLEALMRRIGGRRSE